MSGMETFGEAWGRRGLPRDPPAQVPPFGRRTAEKLAQQQAASAARQVVRKMLRYTPVGKIWDLALSLTAISGDMPAHPGYSNYTVVHKCPMWPQDPNFIGHVVYMKACGDPALTRCLGGESWARGPTGAWTLAGPLNNPAAGRYEIGATITTNWGFICMVQNRDAALETRGDADHVVYKRNVGAVGNGVYTGAIPYRLPFYWPVMNPQKPRELVFPFPSAYPMSSPVARPGMQPGVQPMPIPYRALPDWLPSPYAVPGEAPARGPNRETSPWRKFDAIGVPVAAPVGTAVPSIDLAARGQALEITETGAKLIPSEHKYTKDPKRKEIKTRTARATVALALINQVTEAQDYVDAIWEALPKKCQRMKKHRGLRQMRTQHKLDSIAHCWRELSMFEVVRELFENEVVDQVFGRSSQGLKGLNRQMGRPVGVEAGGALGGGKSSVTGEKGDSPWKDWTEHLIPKTN